MRRIIALGFVALFVLMGCGAPDVHIDADSVTECLKACATDTIYVVVDGVKFPVPLDGLEIP